MNKPIKQWQPREYFPAILIAVVIVFALSWLGTSSQIPYAIRVGVSLFGLVFCGFVFYFVFQLLRGLKKDTHP